MRLLVPLADVYMDVLLRAHYTLPRRSRFTNAFPRGLAAAFTARCPRTTATPPPSLHTPYTAYRTARTAHTTACHRTHYAATHPTYTARGSTRTPHTRRACTHPHTRWFFTFATPTHGTRTLRYYIAFAHTYHWTVGCFAFPLTHWFIMHSTATHTHTFHLHPAHIPPYTAHTHTHAHALNSLALLFCSLPIHDVAMPVHTLRLRRLCCCSGGRCRTYGSCLRFEHFIRDRFSGHYRPHAPQVVFLPH